MEWPRKAVFRAKFPCSIFSFFLGFRICRFFELPDTFPVRLFCLCQPDSISMVSIKTPDWCYLELAKLRGLRAVLHKTALTFSMKCKFKFPKLPSGLIIDRTYGIHQKLLYSWLQLVTEKGYIQISHRKRHTGQSPGEQQMPSFFCSPQDTLPYWY